MSRAVTYLCAYFIVGFIVGMFLGATWPLLLIALILTSLLALFDLPFAILFNRPIDGLTGKVFGEGTPPSAGLAEPKFTFAGFRSQLALWVGALAGIGIQAVLGRLDGLFLIVRSFWRTA
jgi:hypothetical protein